MPTARQLAVQFTVCSRNGEPQEHAGITAGRAERRQLGSHARITFASAPGKEAYEDDEVIGHGLCTKAFVHILKKHERIEVQRLTQKTRALFRSVYDDVQEPWETSSMLRRVYLERTKGGSIVADFDGSQPPFPI
jgi:hypothetical protein